MKYQIDVINMVDNQLPKPRFYRFYCGRGSKLGNPYAHKKSKCDVIYVKTRKLALKKYKKLLRKELAKPKSEMAEGFKELIVVTKRWHKVELACYCTPKKCHCDYIKKVLIKELHGEH